MTRAYALITSNEWSTRTMQHRIEKHPEFETKIKNDPIALLDAIQVLTHDTIRAQYSYVRMTEQLQRFLNIKQHENEAAAEFLKRFKQECDGVKNALGTHMLDDFVANTEVYQQAATDVEKKKLQDDAWERWRAYLFIHSADQAKYGSLKKKLTSDFSLGNDLYPKTLAEAGDALANHKIDQRYYDNVKKKKEKARTEWSKQENEQENEHSNETTFSQREMVCYVCGKKGHGVNTCNKRDKIPPDQWHVRKAISHYQYDDDDHESGDNDVQSDISDDEQSVQSTRTTSSNRSRRSGNNRRNPGWNGYQGSPAREVT